MLPKILINEIFRFNVFNFFAIDFEVDKESETWSDGNDS